jgi:pimeloyl-ACP methyl ester carboxylesterase
VASNVFTKQRTIRVGRVDTNVAEAGDGTAIVLLHGNPDTHTVWNGVVSRLAPRFRCIAPDLPGFGRSVAPADFDVSLAGTAAWTAALFDALELPRAHLVIHDVGGTYGNAFATEHADRVRSLTIFNTNFSPEFRWHFWGRVWRVPILGELAMATGNERLFVSETKKGSPGITDEMAREAYRSFGPATRKMVLRFYREHDPAKLHGWHERLLKATERTPKQVLWGELDPYIPAKLADQFGVAPRRYADCGHWVMIDRPDESAKLIADLVASSG